MGTRYKVRAGDCISSIAFRHGFWPETLWSLPENAELRRRRPSMFQLVPGEDEIFIPKLRQAEHSVAVDKRHCFRRLGVPERLVLRFEDERGEARAGLGYKLEIGGTVLTGETDPDGRVVEWIRPDALRATLTLYPADGEEEPEVHMLMLGRLAPVETERGRRQRLHLLGFLAGAEAEADPHHPHAARDLQRAVARFQRHVGLEDSGEIDATTEAALDEPFCGEA